MSEELPKFVFGIMIEGISKPKPKTTKNILKGMDIITEEDILSSMPPSGAYIRLNEQGMQVVNKLVADGKLRVRMMGDVPLYCKEVTRQSVRRVEDQ
jgi:hypothetical protein